MLKGFTSTPITYKQDNKVDFSLPVGIGGYTKPYITHSLSEDVNIKIANVFFTYKRDDLINLWEGTEHEISGYVNAAISYRPHQDITIKEVQPYLNKRRHDGIDINDVQPYILYKQEDKVDSFVIPYGISGMVIPYITLNIKALCSYINDLAIDKISGIVIENNYFPLKQVKSINNVLIQNNNTI